jgi:two-component system, chemotaxis family, CheB/CheR fusion protein
MSPESKSPLRVAAIGAGESAAAEQVLRGLPEGFDYAVLVSSPLPIDRARAASRLPVEQVDGAIAVESGRVYVVPTDRHFRLEQRQIVPASNGGPITGFDSLLRSIADEVGATSIAVVLAGRGVDGSLGLQRIKEVGGLTIAQEVVAGEDGDMPRAATATGLVDLVLPIDQIAARMVASAGEDGIDRTLDEPHDPDVESLREILTLLRIRTGHDFSSYKRATVYRRVLRRMHVCGQDSVAGYHQYLREHPTELANLLRDFLIGVTQFFRDPATFQMLAHDIMPRLFHGKEATDFVRVWVAGCATGEEAYSLGMLLLEHTPRLRVIPQIQIFATDIDEKALAAARLGCYPETIAADVSPARLNRFFTRENSHYRVHKDLRELVLFSPHNVLRDPPFSRLDLISCRNLLIYLDRDAQTRVLTTFHFGLRHEGLLLLGSSESAEGTALFGAVDAKHRVFARRAAVSHVSDAIVSAGRWHPPAMPGLVVPLTERATPASELHYRMIEKYAPPSVLVNNNLDVVHVSENAGRFLQVGGGEPTRQLLRLAHPALRIDLRAAIYAARQVGSDSRVIRFDDAGRPRSIELTVRSVDAPELDHHGVLVMFGEREPIGGEALSSETGSSIEPVVRELEDELNRTRDQLRTTVEQYETSLEELKASNEELQAINEELRSATEELETSKEELQSVNEELTTLNHELKVKVDEVSHANSDLQNLMTSTDLAVLFLDRQLNIKRFTPRAQDLFNVIASDVGRPLAHLTHRLVCDDLSEVAQTVVQTLRVIERPVTSRDGRSFLARWLPYRSIEDRIEGVVLTFIDVTDVQNAIADRERTQRALRNAEERLSIAMQSAPLVVLGLDAEKVNWGYVMGQELEASELTQLRTFALGHTDRLFTGARQVIEHRASMRLELDLVIAGATRTFDFRIEPSALGVTAVGFDITPSKIAEESLRDADRRKDEFLATLSHELRNPLTPLQVALEVARLTDEQPAQRAQSLSIMERQVAMLTTLVDELLDLSRITQGKIVLERGTVNIAHVLESALVATRSMFEASQHEIRIEVPTRPIELDGDLSRLVQVFTNLLSNAAKYTLPGGHITVTVTPGERVVSVRVQDDGLGIAADMLPRIFEIFVQCRDSRGRSQGGLGIGLNLARRLVELHGGTITAASEGLGRGSAFTVELPLARSA